MLGTVALAIAVTAGSAAAQSGRLTGVVKDEAGVPIKGATVIADNPEASPASFTSTTDDKGRFAMIGLRSGPWLLQVQAPGYAGQRGEANIRQSPTVNAPALFALKKVVAAPSVLGAIAPKDIQTALTAADELYGNQRWDEAIAAYRALLVEAPALSSLNLQIAAAYRSKNDTNGALAAYRELLRVDPNNDKAKVGIAMTNLEKGDAQAAEETLEIASKAPGATRDVFYGLGEIRRSRNQLDEAAAAYRRASELDPAWGRPVLALGRLASTRGDTAGAVAYFEKVIAIDPSSPEAAQARTLLAQANR